MAHKIYNDYWRVCDPQNVLNATNNTLKGKKSRCNVKRLLDGNYISSITDVWEMLERQTYTPSRYYRKVINDGKERRLIIAPLFPDRIVHHCLIDAIEKDLKKLFISNTYACIKGRGMHACLNDLNRALQSDRAGTKYCLKIDIHHYYESIVHEVLKSIIAKKYGDRQMLWLMNTIIDSTEGGVGLPIGFLTSQHFANWYLTPFDHWVKEVLRVKYYYRYMDDMVFLSSSKERLHILLVQIRKYLQDELQLKIKANWQIFPVDSRSIDFVGYKSNHYNILARKGILCRYWKKLQKVARKHKVIDDNIIKLKLSAHWGWLSHCSEEHKNKIFEISKTQNYDR